MKDRTISARNLALLVALMVFNSMLVSGFSETGHNMWLGVVIGLLLYLPLMLLTCRIASLHKGKGIFELIPELLGRLARPVMLLFTVYMLFLTALVVCNFVGFITEISLRKTPFLMVTLGLLAAGVYLAASGLQGMGKWAFGVCFPVLGAVLLTMLLSSNLMDWRNLLPLNGAKPLLLLQEGAYGGMIAFGETSLLLAFTGRLKLGDSPYKAYALGVSLSFVALLFSYLRNILVLGGAFIKVATFPPYIIARIIKIGQFLEHIESVISFVYTLFGITKVAICLRIATMGVAKLMGAKENDKRLLVPVAALTFLLCTGIAADVGEMLRIVSVYFYFAFPFTVLLPFTLWLVSEWRQRRSLSALAKSRSN
jgi:Spore germination protein.